MSNTKQQSRAWTDGKLDEMRNLLDGCVHKLRSIAFGLNGFQNRSVFDYSNTNAVQTKIAEVDGLLKRIDALASQVMREGAPGWLERIKEIQAALADAVALRDTLAKKVKAAK